MSENECGWKYVGGCPCREICDTLDECQSYRMPDRALSDTLRSKAQKSSGRGSILTKKDGEWLGMLADYFARREEEDHD